MIVCAVLAAGGSRRLGSPKQLVVWRGRPLVVHSVEAARASGASEVAVVVGAARDAVESEVSGAALVVNAAWEEGMASSVRAAVAWARERGASALLLHLVDQPRIDGAHLARLIAEHRAGAALVGTRYAEVIGAPALFSRAHFDALEALTGDRGAAGILRAHAETRAVDGPQAALDIDTPEDVAHLLAESRPKATRR